MAFNLGIANHPISRLGGLSTIGIYLYEDIYYRQWITEIALAFYEGRQDEFVWLDLVRQFRNPEKQQILPMNLTKEIVDETSVLYREEPIYQVVDSQTGKSLPKDQELWNRIMEKSRYHMFMDKLDRWVKLLGTVLVKVSFVNPETGELVKKNSKGEVQLDMLHGGTYDLKHGASPYYITELLIGFSTHFGGFSSSGAYGSPYTGGGITGTIPSPSNYGQSDVMAKQHQKATPAQISSVDRIYWSPNGHRVYGKDSEGHEVAYAGTNPYGVVPAIPFFNQDPAHYYFLPINEPLIYANHAINMRITDLNHIAKFQSFGIPVISGVERPTSLRQGRPVDDFNQLKGGSAQSTFGGIGNNTGFGAGGAFRTFDAGMGLVRDGNADAAALGVTIGPDTAVAVGEKGDFKFAHPSADITGLIKVIESITDMVRINHGLRPKYKDTLPSSGFALMMEKMGVLEENIRRAKLFREREQQLFTIVKELWNTHYNDVGDQKFSKNAKLEVTYRQPDFPVDPKTKIEVLMMENKLLDSGDRRNFKKLYPHMSDIDIKNMIKMRRKDGLEQAKHDAEISKTLGIEPSLMKNQKPDVGAPKIDNKVEHSIKSSIQPNRNGDKRSK